MKGGQLLGGFLLESGFLGSGGLKQRVEELDFILVQGSELVLQADRLLEGLLLGHCTASQVSP